MWPPEEERTANIHAIHWYEPGQPGDYPCVDCGLMTGNFCDGSLKAGYDQCFAADRVPKDFPPECYGLMRTPLCSYCETCSEYCHFCRGVMSCTPPRRTRHWSRIPQSKSRTFTAEMARMAMREEHLARMDYSRKRHRTSVSKETVTIIDEDGCEHIACPPQDREQPIEGSGWMPGEWSVVHEYMQNYGKLQQHHTYNFVLQMMNAHPVTDHHASVPYRDRDVWKPTEPDEERLDDCNPWHPLLP